MKQARNVKTDAKCCYSYIELKKVEFVRSREWISGHYMLEKGWRKKEIEGGQITGIQTQLDRTIVSSVLCHSRG